MSSTPIKSPSPIRHRRTIDRWRAIVAAIMATTLALFGIQSVAVAAATEGPVTLTIDYGDETYNGETVVTPGQTYSATLSYRIAELDDGHSVTIAVPQNVTIVGSLDVPAGNTVVQSLERNEDDDLVLTFASPIVSDNDQGVIGFEFQIDEPEEGTGFEDVTWELGGTPSTTTIIVRDTDDEFRHDMEDSEEKSRGSHADLSDFVSYDHQTGLVALDPNVANVEIPYTLRIESEEARTGVEIVDTISDHLTHIEGSVEASLTTWDENGFNRTTAPFSLSSVDVTGQVLTINGIDVPANSILEIRYNARVSDVAALEAALQTAANALTPGESAGTFSVDLGNTALIESTEMTVTTGIEGTVPAAPRPGVSKTVSPSGSFDIALEADGVTLTEPIDVAYSLSVNLSGFQGWEDSDYKLDQNVVISDTLRDGFTWQGDISSEQISLVEASADCTAADDFSADDCVNQYRFDGQILEVNIGQDISRGAVVITAGARITSVEAMTRTSEPSNDLDAQAHYSARNTVYAHYSETRDPRSASVSSRLILPKPWGSEIDDPGVFNKTTENKITVVPGNSVDVPYTLSLAAHAVPDLRNTQWIDKVDTTVFDVSDLGLIQDSISGTYAGSTVTGDAFDIEFVDGDLIFTLDESFHADEPMTGALTFSFDLPTYVLQGKQTIEVKNDARVEGSDPDSYIWLSSATGSATTYGDELEVSKLLYTGDSSWSGNVRAELDDEGEIIQDEFIYRIELIPHGNFFGFAILPIADILPAGVQFEGFVSDSELDAGTTSTSTSENMGGNIVAEWVEADNTIHIAQQSGTVLPQGASVAVNFKVSVTHFTEDVGITNAIGNSSATFTPSNGYPLIILKQDSQRDYVTITDRDARFTVTGPDGNVVTDQAYVVNGQLMVASENGGDAGIVVLADPDQPDVVPAGDYTITETRAPAGYELASEPIIARIGEDGGSNPVTFFNDPAPLYAIGDYVWVDENDDGQQGADEPPLPDVTVELLDPVTGDVLATTHTDVNGRYVFDLLPEGDYRVRFTLTPDQANVYTLTEPDRGGDQTTDSDAARATGETAIITLGPDNEYLVDGEDYEHGDVQAFLGIDPTWDAGVVLRPGTVAVGDYVWVDENKDGRQDTNEPGIPGVTLVLTGPDGEPVIDVDGREVVPQVTDDKGRYLFPHLPVLEEGESYTVTIDQEASADALAPYLPTIPGQGNRAGDSSDWTASSEGLTVAGEVDLTLDFGFVLIPVEPPVEPVTEGGAISDVEEPDVQDDGLLSRTGAEVTALVAASALLLLLGAAFVMWRRRLTA